MLSRPWTIGSHPAHPGGGGSQVVASLAVAQQVRAQDVTRTPDGTPTLRQGVAEDRRISVEDGEMRHGRKSRSLLVDGYKRHVLRDLDSGLIVAVGVTPANAPEASVTDAMETDLAAQQSTLKELHIDRAYLASKLVQQRGETWRFFAKPGLYILARIFPKARSTWIGSGTPCGARVASHALCTWGSRAVSRRYLCKVCVAGALHHQRLRTQRQHSSG